MLLAKYSFCQILQLKTVPNGMGNNSHVPQGQLNLRRKLRKAGFIVPLSLEFEQKVGSPAISKPNKAGTVMMPLQSNALRVILNHQNETACRVRMTRVHINNMRYHLTSYRMERL